MSSCALVHMYVDVQGGQRTTLTLLPQVWPTFLAESGYVIDLEPTESATLTDQ